MSSLSQIETDYAGYTISVYLQIINVQEVFF